MRRVPVIATVAVACLGGMPSGALAADLHDIPAAQPARVVEATFFGTHFHRLVAEPGNDLGATPWPAEPIGSIRLWDSSTRWADIEPEPGRFRFDRLDAYVAAAGAHGAAVLMVLGSPPRWAAARPDEPGPYGPGSQSPPARTADWEAYVQAVAVRYKGRITAYELWNEPYFSELPADRGHPNSFFSGSAVDMVRLAAGARRVIQRADPAALLLSPGFVGGVERLDLFLARGGNALVDGVAWHLYADDDRGLIDTVRRVRSTLARHGLAALPLFDTESGFAVAGADPGGAGRHAAAALLARSMVLAAALGVERYCQYAWDNEASGMTVTRRHLPTPSARAFAAVRRWLLGTTLLGCSTDAADGVVCRGRRGGDRLSIFWRPQATDRARIRLADAERVVSAEYAAEADRPVRSGSDIEVGADPLAVWWREAAAARSVP